MPVVGRGDADCVNGFVFEYLPEILNRFWLAMRVLHSQVEAGLIDVAESHNFHFRLLHGVVEIGAAHAAQADESDGDLIVRAFQIAGEERCGERRRSRGLPDKIAAPAGMVGVGILHRNPGIISWLRLPGSTGRGRRRFRNAVSGRLRSPLLVRLLSATISIAPPNPRRRRNLLPLLPRRFALPNPFPKLLS